VILGPGRRSRKGRLWWTERPKQTPPEAGSVLNGRQSAPGQPIMIDARPAAGGLVRSTRRVGASRRKAVSDL